MKNSNKPENIKMYIDTKGGFQDILETDYYESLNTVRLWHTHNGKETLINTFHLEHEQTNEFLTNYMQEYISNFY